MNEKSPLEELREVRNRLAEESGYNVKNFAEMIRNWEKEDKDREFVDLSAGKKAG